MILIISQAPVADATREHLFAAWSDLQVGDRPDGLVDCFLMEGDGSIQVASVWASDEHHERAVSGDAIHPGFLVFAACGLDPSHTAFKVVGRLK